MKLHSTKPMAIGASLLLVALCASCSSDVAPTGPQAVPTGTSPETAAAVMPPLTMPAPGPDRAGASGADGSELGLPMPEVPALIPGKVTIAQCFTLRDAVEAWAQNAGGRYPLNTNHVNALGLTMIDLLPQGILMVNPVTHVRTSPVDGFAACDGEVGYTCIVDARGRVSGYTISGYLPDFSTFYVVKEPPPSQ